MLRHTFCHIQGVGAKTERRIWDKGIHTWDHACDPDALPLPAGRSLMVARAAQESIRRLDRGDAKWFYGGLPVQRAVAPLLAVPRLGRLRGHRDDRPGRALRLHHHHRPL